MSVVVRLPRRRRTKPFAPFEESFEYVQVATERGPGRQKRYQPSVEQRDQVRAYAAFDWPLHEIADLMGLTRKVLLKHFSTDLQVTVRRSAPKMPGEDVTFPNAKRALLFAVTIEGNPARPASSRMVDATMGGRGLAGLDRAAQAGMILNILESLGKLQIATLIASAAPRALPCHCRRPCCSGRRVNTYWREAVDVLTHAAAVEAEVDARYSVRRELVFKIYGHDSTLEEIASRVHMERHAIGRYHRSVHTWLRGRKAGRNGEPAIEGLESTAWREAESALARFGIVGEAKT